MSRTMEPPRETLPARYDPAAIEGKWQRAWEEQGIYAARDESGKPKYYALLEFPYPSGDGLHVGHLRPYTGMDVVARKRRMQGYEVLFPMGWDAFGLPAENYAIKTGVHPAITTRKNIANFKRQMQAAAFSFDWSREVDTTDPAYYRWTQWIFLRFLEHGLAYKARSTINWCPKDKIGLANEEVVGGACERCGTPVVQKEKEQWMLRITAYADKLLAGLAGVDYLPRIKAQQEHWIGRKEGIEITYPIEGRDETVTVFTTRPDTNFGATFVALSPGNPLAAAIATPEQAGAVAAYVAAARAKKADARLAPSTEKTGVFTGAYAINHLTGRRMPVWVSDFVLDGVGTGALVGVPGHDVRDFEFAQAFGIDIVRVVVGEDGDEGPVTRVGQVQEEAGSMVNSGFLDGKDIHAATELMMDHIEEQGWGKRTVAYHLQDWVFSRQRYWGEPIPVISCGACGFVPVPDDQLPVELPPVEEYQPRDDGESPLASVEEWVNVPCPRCGGPAKRETDVMPGWAGSSWYFLRYTDPRNDQVFAAPDKLARWMPVDWYNGGMEHVTLHLLYSRFWHLFMHDLGLVPMSEPYRKRTAHGMIIAPDGRKMSKSLGNVINPDDVIAEYGADTLRTYEMFIGPFDQTTPWNPRSIEGVYRFLSRVHAIAEAGKVSATAQDDALLRAAKRAARKVGDDIETMAFNTAVSALMIFLNEAAKAEAVPQEAWESFLKALAPFAPHLAEELWTRLGREGSIHRAPWPEISEGEVAAETATVAVQVSGKTRGSVTVPAGASQAEVEAAARADARIGALLGAGEPARVIYVPGRIINFVV